MNAHTRARAEVFEQIFEAHGKKRCAQLIVTGKKHVDQLLRALIPLYAARHEPRHEITSGDIARFWFSNGVGLSGPAAAKALREHIGYARRTKTGMQITPNGIKYVEAAMRAR